MNNERLKVLVQVTAEVGQTRGMASKVPLGTHLLYPRDASADTFTVFGISKSVIITLESLSTDTVVSRRYSNRCWLASSIHALAADDLLFQMSQEMVLMDLPDGVAQARLHRSTLRDILTPVHLAAGVAIAWLMQMAQCHALISTEPNHTLFYETLDLLLDKVFDWNADEMKADPTHEGTQNLQLPTMRALLCAACAVVDPSSAVLAELTRPDGDSYQFVDLTASMIELGPLPLDTFLAGTREARMIEIEAPGDKVAALFFTPRSVQVGKTLYRASHAIRYGHSHFSFFSYNDGWMIGTVVNSHTQGSPLDPVRVGSTNFIRDEAPCHLFLVRV